MTASWLIIADDLTGAADCAVAFAKRRLCAFVAWGDGVEPMPGPVAALAIDAGSRVLDAAGAAQRHRALLRKHLEPGTRVFKKLDSTLRGHPGEEIAAMLDVLSAQSPATRAIVAPAFPAGGRTTRNAKVFVSGVPLEFTEFWSPGADTAHANVVNLLEAAGVPAAHVPLSTVRGEESALAAALAATSASTLAGLRGARPVAAVCDAETEEDLDRIAAAGLSLDHALFVGSAGLAHALVQRISRDHERRLSPVRVPITRRGALVVVGSQARASRAALGGLVTLDGLVHVSLTPDDLERFDGAGLVDEVIAGRDIVVDLAAPDTPRTLESAHARRLARALEPVAHAASAWVATGGETAAALFARCGVTGMQVIDETEHGIALGLTLGDLPVPVVTKAGGFGDAGCLRRVVERLRFIRGSGTVA
jgi:4-hydroxythreonine-4-phosphate dehydrogenase